MIKIAIAINENNEIQQDHFGEAYQFKIYDLNTNAVITLETIDNPMRNFDKNTHGNAKKGQQIVQLLKENKVDAVISKEFGKNIKIINQNFVPIITKKSMIKETLLNVRGLIEEIKEAQKQIPKSLIRIK